MKYRYWLEVIFRTEEEKNQKKDESFYPKHFFYRASSGKLERLLLSHFDSEVNYGAVALLANVRLG
jgi:hypothetical protein